MEYITCYKIIITSQNPLPSNLTLEDILKLEYQLTISWSTINENNKDTKKST